MQKNQNGFNSMDEYIATFPEEVQKKLEELRAVIKASAPESVEKISYQMPTFALKGNLVHFAAYKNHIGFYPTPSGIQAFAQELSIYEGAKGSIRFPIDKPLPLELISKIVICAFRSCRPPIPFHAVHLRSEATLVESL